MFISSPGDRQAERRSRMSVRSVSRSANTDQTASGRLTKTLDNCLPRSRVEPELEENCDDLCRSASLAVALHADKPISVIGPSRRTSSLATGLVLRTVRTSHRRPSTAACDPNRTFAQCNRNQSQDTAYLAMKSFASLLTRWMNCFTTADWSPRREASASMAVGRTGPLIERYVTPSMFIR
jgi:hypothetical protein